MRAAGYAGLPPLYVASGRVCGGRQRGMMRASVLPLTLLALDRRALAQPEQLPPFPNATNGAFFSGVFSDRAVLQRGPRSAVLYGVVIGATPSTTVTVTLQDGGSGPDEAQAPVQARVEVTQMKVPKGGLYARWAATLPPHPAGGDFSATVACGGCGNAPGQTLSNLTFGDVWFCSPSPVHPAESLPPQPATHTPTTHHHAHHHLWATTTPLR